MAELSFTDTALLHIRAVIATSPMLEPVISVVWSKGIMDNTRTAEGSVAWSTVQKPDWFAFISDWHDRPGISVEDYVQSIENLPVYLDKRAKEASGWLLVSLTERGLVVEHTAA